MPKPAPLNPSNARRSLAQRLTGRADRLRQLYTRFGLRSSRVFLVWTRWTGEERGEGDESTLARVEILPTPRVSDLSSVALRPWSAGMLPEGIVRVDQISAGAFTYEHLTGLSIPLEASSARPMTGAVVAGTALAPESDARIDFFWEIVEDGRGASPADRHRYRLFGRPARREGSLYWVVTLEAASDELARDGSSRADDDDVEDA